jgi:hypothetical protein
MEVIMTIAKDSKGEAFGLEQTMLEKYHIYRIKGEWFNFPDDAEIKCDIIKHFPHVKPSRSMLLLNNKYADKGGLCKFIEMTNNRKYGALTKAAEHFGFTRERARQLWNSLAQAGYVKKARY